jgi:hypothetical protein
VAGELWLAGCFNLKGVLWEGPSEREQGREMAYKKVQVLTKILKNRAL